MPVRAMNAYCPPNIRIAGDGFDLNAARAYARGLAERAEALGIRVTGVGSPNSRNLPREYPRQQADAQTEAFLRATAEEMGRRGVTVLLEALAPCFCNYINTTAEAVRLARGAGIGIVADFYNMEHIGEGDTDLKPHIGLIKHAHISDDEGSPSTRSYLTPGKADAHAARVRGLIRAGYAGALT
ncbi:MAG TPA: TIM barrel protein, partial [Clostridia bacterium]|nr:TIM barrel protein [Clostridia bacterium]